MSRKTIYKWLARYQTKGLPGLVDESRRPRWSPMKTSAELALEIVQLRWWRTKDGTRCDPLTVRDAFSRYVLALQLMTRTRTEDVRPVFERLFERYGVPKAVQSDNGPPFASTRALGGLTPLSAWWVSLGIRVVRSRRGRPTDNGGHERMHVDMRFDLEDCAEQDLIAQQRACDDWLTTFNHVRPREGSDSAFLVRYIESAADARRRAPSAASRRGVAWLE